MNEIYLWAALAIGLTWVWIAIWEWLIAKKSIDLMGKNPSMISFFLTATVLWIALDESSAIYWLIVSMNILDQAATLATGKALAAGLTIGITWLAVALFESYIIVQALDSINRNPELKIKIMSFMVLFVALVESAAIYALIISMKILG